MQCDICQGGLESIYLQKKESPELENERPRWCFLLLEGEYKFWGWIGKMSQEWGDGAGLHIFPWMPSDHILHTVLYRDREVCHLSSSCTYTGCNAPLQAGYGGLRSTELMQDLYQFGVLQYSAASILQWPLHCNINSQRITQKPRSVFDFRSHYSNVFFALCVKETHWDMQMAIAVYLKGVTYIFFKFFFCI